ncbi:MAG: hypothetical protein O9340_10470 [Cyclobacteriaceae bacterium]|jgi:hypothetical protein|nr:hypothetical protein [Cyclobacteriaceae bacterium]
MKVYDFVMIYFYQIFKRKDEGDPIVSSIPYVSGLVMIHLIFIIVLANYFLKFNFLIEHLGVKQGQGKYYSLPVVIVFFVISDLIVKSRYRKLKKKNKLEEDAVIHLWTTVFLISLYVLPIIIGSYLI